VAGLYSLDPTRERRWPPWPTRGSLIAVGLWVTATIGFEIYLLTLASYDQTYGTLGGVVTFLVWAWLSNIVLLYGLALDQERRHEQ
jgi:membrane protein